jgi:hypothetical protein
MSVSGWVFGATPTVTQSRLACIAHDTNARITAHVEGHPTSVRVYFRQADDPCGAYYVDMRPSPKDPTEYSAVLPVVSNDATAIIYQVRVQNPGAKELAAEPMTANVTGNCQAPPLSADDARAANAIALGLTSPEQHAAPCKFKCRGVVSVITSSGQLKPNDECRLILAGLVKPWWATPAGIAGASAGALGAGLAIHSASGNGRTGPPPSPARP